MEEKEIRLLRADEIECRVATVSDKGVSLLLYKDARVDQKILDETYTPLGWKRTHQSIEGNLYCTVEVYDSQKGEWIAKQDVGGISYSEKEKGQASDSFKRACVNWGIGRELYTAPFIWLPAGKVTIQPKSDKYVCYDKFNVRSIEYSEQREIIGLVITNEKGQIVYELKTQNQKVTTEKVTAIHIRKINSELKRTGVAVESVLNRYGITDLKEMTIAVYEKAMEGLSKTKTKAA